MAASPNTISLTGKQWSIRDTLDATNARAAHTLSASFQVSPFIGEVLFARGITDEEAWRRTLEPRFEDLHDPSLLLGMDEGVRRILCAIDANERILIYGDYDVDGTTGTVVLRRALELIGAQTGYHIPHRFTEGYGVNQVALEKAKREGYTLVITVDCGIRGHEPLTWARDNNLDCIVTDHHLPDATEGAPPAVAVINPNQAGCPYPDKHLAGVGVAFKLAHSLLRARGRESLIKGFLKMVAIGTVADIAPLVGENRTIVQLGLADLPKASNHGLRALMEVAGCFDKNTDKDGMNGANGAKKFIVNAMDIGFRLAPRINAAGRMDAARQIVELFEATNETVARDLAMGLDKLNRERQEVQKQIVGFAVTELESDVNAASHVAVIAGENWHRGVIGLAASKIAEKYNRPAIVISLDGEHGHGSARSIEDYHLLDGLTSCAKLFEQFGGHAAAAGLKIRRDRINDLRTQLNSHAVAHFGASVPAAKVNIDYRLPASEITRDFIHQLNRLEPLGAGWRKPVFMTGGLRVAGDVRVMKDRHLKIYCLGQNGKRLEAVWWNAVEHLRAQGHDTATLAAGQSIELAYTLELNTWQGEQRVQLVVQDTRKAVDNG
ncbi:MAG: single-stranded-DNA-specific exonuclease RecJ [Pyrinomonadaceae bacterium MAG19_C2-C3]|nr:single-stranded-DNA-specific exonuclease RecJ [Pyrinomonadaceae bacterium MAG19_C2-C3]